MGQHTQSCRNRLLELLNPEDFSRLRLQLKAVTFEYRQPLYEANEPVNFVYFPIDGVASLVNTMSGPWLMYHHRAGRYPESDTSRIARWYVAFSSADRSAIWMFPRV